eukprot:4447945-Karenia_brevis.AAC.1
MGFEPLTMRVLRAVHKLAGELRHSNENHHVHTLLPSALRWRDGVWWQALQTFGMLEDPHNAEQWKHESSMGNRGRKWDDVLIDCYGHDWAWRASKSPWHESVQQFMTSAFSFVCTRAPALKT